MKWRAASCAVVMVVVWLFSVLAAKDASNDRGSGLATTKALTKQRATNESPQTIVEEGVIVSIRADGERQFVWLPNGTVKDALDAANVTLAPYDRVKPSLNTKLKNGMDIVVERVQITEERQWEFIHPTVLYRFDTSLQSGRMKIVSSGKVGLAEVVVKVYRKDGKVTLKKVLSKNIVREPVPAIIAVGVKRAPVQLSHRGVLPSRGMPVGIRVLTMVATGYYPGPKSCGKYADGLTATGIKARRGVVAVDPRVIPLGTRLYIEGYGYAIAADTGGAIKGNKIDLCFNTYEEAIKWGIRQVRVLILSLPNSERAEER
ncbi:MAG: 3D domain-containing protein [Armatimonadota bacterium]|nr:3D domain-containing protein [Armatimonadota bacterium]